MAKIQHLSNPPITEAIIEIQIVPEASIDDSLIKEIFSGVSSEFPEFKELRSHTNVMKPDENGALQFHSQTMEKNGIIANSVDAKYAVQFRKNGFSLSRLKPYEKWSLFFVKAKKLWDIYQIKIGKIKAARFGVRFINVIEKKLPANVEDFFETETFILPEFCRVESFASQADVREPDSNLRGKLNIATAIPKSDKKEAFVRIMVDVDTYRDFDLSLDAEFIDSTFEQLHDFKNRLFFGLLTENILEGYK